MRPISVSTGVYGYIHTNIAAHCYVHTDITVKDIWDRATPRTEQAELEREEVTTIGPPLPVGREAAGPLSERGHNEGERFIA